MNKHKMEACGIVLLIAMLTFLSTGCTGAESELPEPERTVRPATIRLTPVDLFAGEGAKFRLFLGAMSGAFKLSYEGVKPDANLDIDLWENGSESREVEVIISVDPAPTTGKDTVVKVGTVRGSGTSLATLTVPLDNKLTTKALMAYSAPGEFAADKPVPVWGMQASSSDGMRVADLSSESLSGVEWALVFTLRFEG